MIEQFSGGCTKTNGNQKTSTHVFLGVAGGPLLENCGGHTDSRLVLVAPMANARSGRGREE